MNPKLKERGTNKVQNLSIFLDENKNVTEGDMWFYGLNPEIVAYLNRFNKQDGEDLIQAIDNWDDEKIYNLADSLLDTDNMYIDGKGLYAEIFLRNSNPENDEYLVENIHLIYDGRTRKKELQTAVLLKIEAMEIKFNRDYSYFKDWVKKCNI